MESSTQRKSTRHRRPELGSQDQALHDPTVVARDESGPRYFPEGPLRRAFSVIEGHRSAQGCRPTFSVTRDLGAIHLRSYARVLLPLCT